jgi:photosystem II stability/assembly factor-like uncharacterized protein
MIARAVGLAALLVPFHVVGSALGAAAAEAQEIVLVPGSRQEFRGLSSAGADLWASGRDGTFARSRDAGRSWAAGRIPGAETLFLVDVEALGRDTACVLATSFDGGLARAYRTTNGGATWSVTYELAHPQVFLDGMAFWDRARGLAFGDPVDSAFFVLRTADGCASWSLVAAEALPEPQPGEAGFAASGTAIAVAGSQHAWIGTGGGAVARVLRSTDGGRSWEAVATPMSAGAATGIFGIAFRDTLHGVAVGGNYQEPAGAAPNVLMSSDGGRSWTTAGPALPGGVRYGVAAVGGAGAFVAAGPSGIGVTADDGITWMAVDTLPAFALHAAGDRAWIGGTRGWVASFDLRSLIAKARAPER